jgi:phosphoglycerate dehydrogenase-like enzyme
VFADEPHVAPGLLTLANVIVEPHHAGGTIETREAVGRLVIDNIVAKLEGRPLVTPVV